MLDPSPELEALAEAFVDEAMAGFVVGVPARVRDEMRAAMVDELLFTPEGRRRLFLALNQTDTSGEVDTLAAELAADREAASRKQGAGGR